jgi:hypothetical protein
MDVVFIVLLLLTGAQCLFDDKCSIWHTVLCCAAVILIYILDRKSKPAEANLFVRAVRGIQKDDRH